MSLKFVLFICIAFGYFITFGVSSCPAGYCWQSSGCYLVVGLNVSWIDARNYCEVLGGTLLSIESSAAQSTAEITVRRFKGTIFPGKFWLDFNDLMNPNDWKRMRDHHTLEYENWHPERGSTAAKTTVQNCIYMDQGYRWSPENCGEKMNFICYASGSTSSVKRYGNRYDNSEEDSAPEVMNTPKACVMESEDDLPFDPFGWFKK